MAAFAAKVPTLVVTRSEQGAIAVRGSERAEVPAEPIERLVDTTGAGDLFAAGLPRRARREGWSLEDSLKLGAIAAAEVIQHYGARPEADLKALAGDCSARSRKRGGRSLPFPRFMGVGRQGRMTGFPSGPITASSGNRASLRPR